MMNAKDLGATVVAVLTFLIRPFIFLILGLAIGYGIGFTDAFRDGDSLGYKVARVVYRMHPEAVSEGIYQRASRIRDTIQVKSGVVDTIIPPN
jgi:hypothetical protein